MKPLSKKIINEIKRILAIRAKGEMKLNKDFTMKFDQLTYGQVEKVRNEHICQTAGCLAGFKVFMDAISNGFKFQSELLQ